jgi:tetratricopeptide (TPR) repeat protein
MEMSETFQIAYSLTGFNNEQAISLYDEELKVHPNNIAAWGNRGLCKFQIAKEKSDKNLLEDSNADFKKAIEIMDKKGYSRPNIIDANLKLAEETFFK